MTERTPDGRYIVVNGRRWRASDPDIPQSLNSQLVKELMRARRAVKDRGDEARFLVNDAKFALGERGEPWWEATPDGQRTRLRAAILTLLRHRNPKTICPSEAARVVGGDDGFRPLMDMAREVAAELAAESLIEVQQKGEVVDASAAKGPIRLAPGPQLER
ncbi:DUF3253 domain-containing protein [Corynebacterium tapiri]|uniref:DUF3253 domain-containing protein n=1 Tax=Corynebacterium tapiri TaxID=1448266 RepID=A0A5C4U7Y6_9CORY|nr:DUF3253 domain-containing protein [Corynebacterium tapiri]TNM00520.1 DUF3253 domain-containing protein [Corynebacterium tapiri]